ncbi:Glyceraldehyde-3-phosphate dehydrogenase [Venturia nashicola]|nr:Glyceraldehyde-3-phosphate dehydrogenase [Venturia nashicola]
MFTSPPKIGQDTMTMNFYEENIEDDPNNFNNSSFFSEFINDFESPMPQHAQINFGSPAAIFAKQEPSPLPQLQPRSAVSSASPESSSQDSSSDSSGRRKRKSPSSSSPSVMFGYPTQEARSWMGDDMDIDRKRRMKVDSPVFRQDDSNMGLLNTSMTESFNLHSTGHSPPALVNTPATSNWNASPPRSMGDQEYHNVSAQARTPAAFSFGSNSRDNTPPSAISFEGQHTPFLAMRDSPDTDNIPYASRNAFGDMNTFSTMFPSPTLQSATAGTVHPSDIGRSRYKMIISPLGHKSRVETQIPVKFTVDPMPPGVKKIHLPTETIAKAKFLAKESLKSPDTLELSAMLVCTSAMEKPENKVRALELAREGTHLRFGKEPRRCSTGEVKKSTEPDPNDPDSPINGGPVKICDNCVSRERKRAGRKKSKKQEDEERWYEYEHNRIIMFNTQEYLDFHPPTPTKEQQYYDPTNFSPEAMQVDAPMRIVCYCRHQQEKTGFQVIFTLKDYQGRVLAQEITQSILITDDHKTHTQGINTPNGLPLDNGSQYAISQSFGNSTLLQPVQGLPGRAYHSSTNLASMGGSSYWSNPAVTSAMGQSSTASMTPRNLSRPASPSGHMGPKKKRKGSGGVHKLPANLMMTRADLEPISIPSGTTSAAQAMNSMVSPETAALQFDPNVQFAQGGQNYPITTPATPNGIPSSRDSKPTDSSSYFFSAPNSAHASRAASPTSFTRPQMANTFQPSQSQMAAPANPQFMGMQYNGEDQQHPTPIVLKVRPDKGPLSGNIEVVVLGKHFHRNLEVVFGDSKATTTTFWNSDTLVCLLPPCVRAGPVPVTFVISGRQHSPPSVSLAPMFTYVDDSQQRLFELAIQLQCAAQMGPGVDHYGYAQNILATHGPQNGFPGGQGATFNGNVLSKCNAEDLIMAIINKVDLIDSPYTPNYDTQRNDGASMISLACSLGLERVVAGLLARGAHPDLVDVGGYTPLMFASMHGHASIVRRLVLRGADTSLRNLRGQTAAELASSPEVRHFVRHRRHYRSASAGTPYFRSRADSAASTRSMWGPPSSGASSTMYMTEDESVVDSEVEEVETVAPIAHHHDPSRRTSGIALRSRHNSDAELIQNAQVFPVNNLGSFYGTASSIAMLSALRDQFTAQIIALQQNLPNMQDQLDQLEHSFPAFSRRISSLVPTRRPASPRTESPSADAPPPYHEACPDGADNGFDTKPPELFTTTAESSRNASIATLRPFSQTKALRQRSFTGRSVTIGETSPTGEEAAQLRRLRQEKLITAKHDRNLWLIWVPLFIAIVFWWFSGLRLPPVMSWLKTINETVADTFGKALPALPTIPNIMRLPV